MNAIIDLTARATSFITLIQSTLLKGAIDEKDTEQRISILTLRSDSFKKKLKHFIAEENENLSSTYSNIDEDILSEKNSFEAKAQELVWVSSKDPDVEKLVEYTIGICIKLHAWINKRRENEEGENDILVMQKKFGEYPTPYNWRETLSRILYNDPKERIELANALEYMPIQVVLALGGGEGYKSRSQRILQVWGISEENKKIMLNAEEIKLVEKFEAWEKLYDLKAAELLQNDEKLFECLVAKNAPLSFEFIFKKELQEIQKNRVRRENEGLVANGETPVEVQKKHLKVKDPFDKGKEMELYALAFSGGGIRSATFNLGILEGLAQKSMLGRFDYLSTVSGGGYIGSWLAAWIKRDGAVLKVSNRLCPNKSPDPLGEELKPIKWLRMFSNYFAPRASLMSADSWTVGVTWLRNTLLNQVIIFLLLLSVLFAGNAFYKIWDNHLQHTENIFNHDLYTYWCLVALWSSVFVIPVSLLAGFGMHAYNSESFHWKLVRKEQTNKISRIIIAAAVFAAYIISAWLASTYYVLADPPGAVSDSTVYDKLRIFLPTALVTFVGLIIVAWLGKYVMLIKKFQNSTSSAIIIIVFTGLVATGMGLISLALVSVLLENMSGFTIGVYIEPSELQFIFGVPLTLEIFCIAVVTRMALLGKYFPDERREWWGRMGAYIHRIAFIWILVTASALLGQKFMFNLFSNMTVGLAATGGWMALIGSTVKAAFSSASATPGKKSTFSTVLDLLGKAAPYVFVLGLLIFLPGLLGPLIELEKNIFSQEYPLFKSAVFLNFLMMIVTLLLAYLLARQVGVNEFSMHHFYRNRLVRAYLGATRRTTDRQRSSNPFTGFDKKDDEKLDQLQNKFGYYGPYPVLNTALNASQELDLDRQDRKAESFIFSPLFCGFDFSMARSSADVRTKPYDYAYRQTKDYAYRDGGPTIGTAMATSGAAVNPNQGYHSSAATAFMLTVFNVQMGRWIGNPRKDTWQKADPDFGLGYLINNLVGKTSTRNDYIALSDGGHFDNMGLYEMVRRRCRVIVLCDAEQDDLFTCEGFANAVRRCRIDFGAEIKIDITPIVNRRENRFSAAHYAIGTIRYAGDNIDEPYGKLLYIKSSITGIGEEPVDVREYAIKNQTFPHQTTADQFFDEEQFESYRKLGLYIANIAFHEFDEKMDLLK